MEMKIETRNIGIDPLPYKITKNRELIAAFKSKEEAKSWVDWRKYIWEREKYIWERKLKCFLPENSISFLRKLKCFLPEK